MACALPVDRRSTRLGARPHGPERAAFEAAVSRSHGQRATAQPAAEAALVPLPIAPSPRMLGLLARKYDPADLFHPTTLDT